MRLAYICADAGVPAFGRKGSSVHVQAMLRAFGSLVSGVDLFTACPGGEPPADIGSVRVHVLPSARGADIAARERGALRVNRALRQMLDQHGRFDLVYERYSLWSHAGIEWARRRRLPALLEVNAPLIDEQAEHRGLVHRAHAEHVAVRAFSAATALIAVSREVAAYLARFPGVHGRVHVIPNGVDASRFARPLRPTKPGPPGAFTIGFVGTLKPWHGLSLLAEAFSVVHRRFPGTRLLVVGDGPERERFEATLRNLGLLDATCFTGAVQPAEVPGLLASMDVGVAPYPPQSSFYFSPLKVFEYMAAGLPVVASRLGQIAEVVEHGRTGLLCPPGDPVALGETLCWLVSEPDLRARLGDEARRGVLRDHTWERVARAALDLAHSGTPDACAPR